MEFWFMLVFIIGIISSILLFQKYQQRKATDAKPSAPTTSEAE